MPPFWQRFIQGSRPPSSKLRGARAMTICACFAHSYEPMRDPAQWKEPFLKVLAVCFCGRHRGDQGSERTDWAGLEPSLSPGTRRFNHRAVKQSDRELHMPLDSPVSLPLCLHLCLLSLFASRPLFSPPANILCAATFSAASFMDFTRNFTPQHSCKFCVFAPIRVLGSVWAYRVF